MSSREFREANRGFEADAALLDREQGKQLIAFLSDRFGLNTKTGKLKIHDELEGDLGLLTAFDAGGSPQMTPVERMGYFVEGIRGGRLRSPIMALLGWICARHPGEAAELYARLGLAREGMSYRTIVWPGGGPSKKGGSFASAALQNDDGPGPIIPAGYDWSDDGPFLDDGGHPTRPPIRLPHPDGIDNAGFSYDGKAIVTAGKAGDLFAGAFRWTIDPLSPGTRKTLLARSDSDILFAAFLPSDERIITSSQNIASIWHAGTLAEPIFTLAHDDQIAMCSVSNDGAMIATASWDQTAAIWCARRGARLKTFRPALPVSEVVNSVYFSPDDAQVVLGCTDGTVSIWDVQSERKLAQIDRDASVGGAMFTRDGARIVVAYEDGTAILWDAATQAIVRTFGEDQRHKDTVWSAELSSDETMLVTASQDRFAFVWDVATGQLIGRLRHKAALYAAHFSPDDRWVLTACDDGNAYLWRVG